MVLSNQSAANGTMKYQPNGLISVQARAAGIHQPAARAANLGFAPVGVGPAAASRMQAVKWCPLKV